MDWFKRQDSGVQLTLFGQNRTLLSHYLAQTKTLLESLTHPRHPFYYESASPLVSSIKLDLSYPLSHKVSTTGISGGSPSKKPALTTLKVLSLENNGDTAEILSQLEWATNHVERLSVRIADKHSHVLVTGDLNAGKSTLVNTLLRRQIVPEDQQPCTSLFVEVSDPNETLDGLEQVHGVLDPSHYNPMDATTFILHPLVDLPTLVEDNVDGYAILKVYCQDDRHQESSILHNGLVDISLIDSPGLNIDSFKTTSLLSKQEEIDVIVFVVNAENHFTLSAKEFLAAACKEKAYVFIIVNKFDNISRKERCQKDILEQIREISEDTFESASTLVHFVSARQAREGNPEWLAKFDDLEGALRSFILEKRSKSKLAPAKTYLANVLNDLEKVAIHNYTLSDTHLKSVESDLTLNIPILKRMTDFKTSVLDTRHALIEETGQAIFEKSRDILKHYLEEIEWFSQMVSYDGIFSLQSYAAQLQKTLFNVRQKRVVDCRTFAEETCLEQIGTIAAQFDMELIKMDSSPITDGFQQMRETETVVLSSSYTSLFSFSDQLDILKDYLPGFGMLVSGVLGYRGILKFSSFRLFTHPASLRLGRLGFVSLAVAGLGWMIYNLSDMQNSIRKRIVHATSTHIQSSGFIEKHATLLAQRSRSFLHRSLNDHEERFNRVLKDKQFKADLSAERQHHWTESRLFFEKIWQQAVNLQSGIDQIVLDID